MLALLLQTHLLAHTRSLECLPDAKHILLALLPLLILPLLLLLQARVHATAPDMHLHSLECLLDAKLVGGPPHPHDDLGLVAGACRNDVSQAVVRDGPVLRVNAQPVHA
jgi:hypothetical protein